MKPPLKIFRGESRRVMVCHLEHVSVPVWSRQIHWRLPHHISSSHRACKSIYYNGSLTYDNKRADTDAETS